MTTPFRPTTLERAYELARTGQCRTVGEIKSRLQAEGHEGVRDRLYGSSLTSALRKLCAENYGALQAEEAAPESETKSEQP